MNGQCYRKMTCHYAKKAWIRKHVDDEDKQRVGKRDMIMKGVCGSG